MDDAAQIDCKFLDDYIFFYIYIEVWRREDAAPFVFLPLSGAGYL